jgi:chorismate-pyruvate lyase
MIRKKWSVLASSAGLLLALASAHEAAQPNGPSASQAAAPHWRDTFTSRVEVLALLQSLNADLLSHDSATLTLESWCEQHHLATPAHVVAERVRDFEKPAGADQRQVLKVSETEPIRYRHVRLRCGDYVLSEADNWYVPAHLTSEMNQALDTTDTPFGRVVLPLHFQRHTLSAALLWSPLPRGWEMGAQPDAPARAGSLTVPAQVLQHRAVLTLPDGTPFSEVVETYTSAVLAFPEPPHP